MNNPFILNKEWVVVELNPIRNLLQSLVGKLYSLPEMYTHFVQLKS